MIKTTQGRPFTNKYLLQTKAYKKSVLNQHRISIPVFGFIRPGTVPKKLLSAQNSSLLFYAIIADL
jgi:hypothetical protein